MTSTVLRAVRPWGAGPPVDVRFRGGAVEAIGPDLDGDEVVDGGGGIAVPAFADAHAHLDSTRLGLPFREHTAEPGLRGLIMNDRANWRRAEASVADRATHTLGRTIARGATVVRSHAQVDTDCGLERLHGVLAARDAHAGRAVVQVVAFPQAGVLRDPGTADLLDAALREGADLVGGLDPAGYDRDPVGHLDTVFGLADKHGVGVDVHLHDPGELGAFEVELICERALALDLRGRVAISHCFALAGVDADRQAALVDLLAEADVALTTVAPGAREPLPVDRLRAAGVRLGLGQDGIRDYWSPYGNADMLDRTYEFAHRSGLRRDDEIAERVRVATTGGAAVCGLTGHDLVVGGRGDVVVLRGDALTAAVVDRDPDRLVLRAGRLVARAGELC
ncbi:N-isopropylammelide isopropylaminohydrolase [Actinokineospora bangkokensis]|uniref:N-isopropylammelide isopropylaminohydrolase n=1 Tax=Actinokineospora bangkokensis TaxID=1193682 RepID=A0A1Q9LT86_9PSEU|nr:N-isopropylammelide isopropylaminohydrolase [Actinokineospora bangkokensis]